MGRRVVWMAVLFLAVFTAGAGLKRVAPEPKDELKEARTGIPTGVVEQKERDWPMFRRDLHHSGYSPEKVPPPLGVAWKYSIGQPIVSSPAVVGGRVYFGSRDSCLHALDATTGKSIWKYETGGWIDSSPTVSDDLVYFASRDGFVYCLSPFNGRLSWRYHTGGADCSSPSVIAGVIYTASGFPNEQVLALTSRSGRLLWTYETNQAVYSSPVVKDGVVYIGSNDGRFYALSQSASLHPNPRPPVWSKWVSHTDGGVYFSSPAISDSLIYCIPGDYDKRIYCLRLSDGSVKWSYGVDNSKTCRARGGLSRRYARRIEGGRSMLKGPDFVFPFVYVSSTALAHELVYFVSGYPEQSVYALDALDGSLSWSQPIGATIGLGYSSSPAVGDSVLYVGSGDGTIYAFNAINGASLWSYETGSPIISSPAVADGRLWVATWGGDLYCFQSAVKTLTSVSGKFAEPTQVLPKTFALLPATPNPFTTSTTIPYHLTGRQGDTGTRGHSSTCQLINLSVYDVSGRLVKTLVDEPKTPGYYSVAWDGKNQLGEKVTAGVYFQRLMRLSQGREVIDQYTRKLILLR